MTGNRGGKRRVRPAGRTVRSGRGRPRDFCLAMAAAAVMMAPGAVAKQASKAPQCATPAAAKARADRIATIMAEHLDVSMERIRASKDLIKDVNADSLDLVELVMAFEEEFNIEIADDDADGMNSFQQVVDYINARCKAGTLPQQS